MLFNKLFFLMILLIAPLALKKSQHRKIYFIDDDSLVILNGNVKRLIAAPVDDANSSNPGEDYDTIDVNENGDIIKIITGFHGMVFKTYYKTEYNIAGSKLETKGFMKPKDVANQFPAWLLKAKQKDTLEKLIFVYKYNKNDEIVNYVVNPGTPAADSTTYKYNQNGDLIELDHYTNSKVLMDVTTYVYDGSDNLIEADKFHWNKLMVKMLYKYLSFDLKNNWIDMIMTSELLLVGRQVQTSEIRRKIAYY